MLLVAVKDPTPKQRHRMVNGTITALQRSYHNHIWFEIGLPVECGRQGTCFQEAYTGFPNDTDEVSEQALCVGTGMTLRRILNVTGCLRCTSEMQR